MIMQLCYSSTLLILASFRTRAVFHSPHFGLESAKLKILFREHVLGKPDEFLGTKGLR